MKYLWVLPFLSTRFRWERYTALLSLSSHNSWLIWTHLVQVYYLHNTSSLKHKGIILAYWMQGQLNNSPHSSFLQQECVSCAYMAEEGHSLVSGLTALHWETAKICLKPAFLLPGEAGSRGFLISWYLLQHAERRGGLKSARCGRVEMPPPFSASLPQPKAAHMQMLEPFHQLCPSRSPRGRTPKWLPGPEEHNILWKHSRVPLLTSSPILDSCLLRQKYQGFDYFSFQN